MMMKGLCKTLSKTSNFLHNQTPIRLNSFSISLFSTNIPSHDQEPQLQSHIEQNNDEGVKKVKNLARPSEIPLQPKVANWVNLIGEVRMPVKFVTSTDGTAWAGTVISQEQLSSTLPLIWIPVIFKGDLANTAMMHLKEKDRVHVAGHLTPNTLPINLTTGEGSVQVMVQDVHFVRGFRGMNNPSLKRPKQQPPDNPTSRQS